MGKSLDKLSSRIGSSKGSVQKLIKCSHRSCGVTEYFIVNQGKWRGCWQSEETVDLSALALDRSNRIQERKVKIAMEVERKRREEAERKRREEVERKRKEEVERKKKEEKAAKAEKKRIEREKK